jgi:murein L,D-transpeptidase YafK
MCSMFPRLHPKYRVVLLALVGLGLMGVAVHRWLMPAIAQFTASRQPIVCPAESTIHTALTAAVHSDRPLADLLPQHYDRGKVSILIEKSRYRLTVYYNQTPIKSYPVVFGDPQGDKRREGDRKTPEGILQIQDKYPHSTWSKFLWLNYPNAQSECKHNRAKQQGEIPANSQIGGEVGIHGVPIGKDAKIDQRINWTLGCPSLKTLDINELYDAVQVGTVVEIVA